MNLPQNSDPENYSNALNYQAGKQKPSAILNLHTNDLDQQLRLMRIRKAAENKDYQRALRLSQELSLLAPDNVETWLYCAAFSQTRESKIEYLSKALALAPDNQSAKLGMYEVMRQQLQESPFLSFLEQDQSMYQVQTNNGLLIALPKPCLPEIREADSPLQVPSQWLFYGYISLPFAGILALCCATAAGMRLLRLLPQNLGAMDRRHCILMLIQSILLWLAALSISYLFLLHLIPL